MDAVAITWTKKLEIQVNAQLSRFPQQSSKCAAAARAVLPLARQISINAHARLLTPKDGAPKLMRRAGGVAWFHHVAVEVRDHKLDAMTGSPGHEACSYVDAYFQHSDCIADAAISDKELADTDPGMEDDDS